MGLVVAFEEWENSALGYHGGEAGAIDLQPLGRQGNEGLLSRLWHRIAGVLLELTPRVRARLATGDSTFARYLDHARRGAELARDDGASERVVRLIARHHQRPVTKDELLLARADREALP